ncbi:hypothetical protein LOM8899_02125 [Flavimaricola marinus]|uniref:DUF1697 domain-containing protein n=2 Tax=Flavimaricola marinus TaxID=1819565 RepID=A0A238LE76_9RHOB|nr:hypothetical protein LOM8899_02125 [Flavimaricola marinus]
MAEWVALLRGVNVGGGNKVPMADLRALATGLGWTDVRSYIASGNLVFSAEGQAGSLAAALRQAMVARMGVDVPVLVLPGAAIRAALSDCPFQPEKGSHVHAFFLWSEAVIDEAVLEAHRAPTETFVCQPRIAWLHAPDGIGRSKLAERMSRVVTGTEVTARNLNTVAKLAAMLTP